MTTTTRSPVRERRGGGFTLVEVMIGATLASFVLVGVLGSFLFLGRSGTSVQHYNDMEAQARQALEVFAEDVRQASAISWQSSNQVTLTVNSASIVYAYTSGSFVRRTGTSTRTLVSGILAPVARTSDTDTTCTPFFRAYDINGTQIKAIEYASPSASALTAAGKTTKQLQISLEATRADQTVVTSTNTVLSARFILRNKRITT